MATKTPTASVSGTRRADAGSDKTGAAAGSDRIGSAAEPDGTVSVRLGPFSNAELAALSNAEVLADLEDAVRVRAALDGRIVQLSGESERRQAFRERGATSLIAHLAGPCGFSSASARTIARVGERLFDLPYLQGALSSGELSLDQVRAVVGVAEPESDARWAEAARGRPVSDLVDLAQRTAAEADKGGGNANTGPVKRSVRFNDASCTMTARLPKDDFVSVRAAVDAQVKAMGSDGETPLDERAGDALLELLGDAQRRQGHPDQAGRASQSQSQSQSQSPWAGPSSVVVAHVALGTLLDGEEGALALAELESAGLVSADVVRRLACDARLVVALDDDAGHTMYEGRARRFPTETQRRELWRRDRHCRFPGCTHDRFTRVHHIVPWKPDGRTDLDNLVELCEHHHHEVHSKRWSVSGDANVELTFVGPGGRVMTSRPSPLWGEFGSATKVRSGARKVVDQAGRSGTGQRRVASEKDYEPPP